MFNLLSSISIKEVPETAFKLILNGEIVGFIREDFISRLSTDFILNTKLKTLEFPLHQDFDKLNLWIDKVFRKYSENKIFWAVESDKWRNELYPIYNSKGDICATIERSAIPIIGSRSFGTHLNGYIKEDNKITKLWIAKRSKNKQTYPLYLDNLCGGGLGIIQFKNGILQVPSAFENVVKEAFEEASLLPTISRKEIIATGFISFFRNEENRGLIFDTEYVFDIELTNYKSYFPKPMDGEVECFSLLSIDEIKAKLLNLEFTPEATFVTVDFLVRHGIINCDNESRYLDLISLLRSGTFGLPGPL